MISEEEILRVERDSWKDTARFHCQNESFYRGLLDQISGAAGLKVGDYSEMPAQICRLLVKLGHKPEPAPEPDAPSPAWNGFVRNESRNVNVTTTYNR